MADFLTKRIDSNYLPKTNRRIDSNHESECSKAYMCVCSSAGDRKATWLVNIHAAEIPKVSCLNLAEP